MRKVILANNLPLVNVVAHWLEKQALATPSGVPALDHLLVLTPTRQAGRRLRERLAETFATGCIPPRIMQPFLFLRTADTVEPNIPSQAEQTALLTKLLIDLNLSDYPSLFPVVTIDQNFNWALKQAEQLLDIWRILAEGALTFTDVSERIETLLIGEDLDVEVNRWHDLAKIEDRFFDFLKQHQLIHPTIALRQHIANPAVPADCKEIVLPAVIDGTPALYEALKNLDDKINITLLIQADQQTADGFDDNGMPAVDFWLNSDRELDLDIPEQCIHQLADSATQAEYAAEFFKSIPDNQELPALGMVDSSLFRELQSAFSRSGFQVHNPAGFPLSGSSLTRLIQQIAEFSSDTPYQTLAAFLRQDDTITWLEKNADLTPQSVALMLHTMDELQNAHLPQTMRATLAFARQEIAELELQPSSFHAQVNLRKQGLTFLVAALESLQRLIICEHTQITLNNLTAVLKELFDLRTLSSENRKDRELIAAARAIMEIVSEIDTPLTEHTLNPDERYKLFDALLRRNTYQLEPPPGFVIQTEGWLELPWNPSPEIIITGFNEECIPASIVGHPFLPDLLRRKLGLSCNDLRAARDTCILYNLLKSREPGAIQLLLERANSVGDVRKPSRLLFRCNASILAERAARLFNESETAPSGTAKSLPEEWRLNLPLPRVEDTPKSLSVTRINDYLKCPFTFYLKHILKMESVDDRAVEMDNLIFGTLCHNAIEAFSTSELKCSTNAGQIHQMLSTAIACMVKKQYGAEPPAVIVLQLHSAQQRLRYFADWQAKRNRQGWEILTAEQKVATEIDGIAIRGRIDRIDYLKSGSKLQLIDFKTWDKIDKKAPWNKVFSSAKADIEFARQCGLPVFTSELSKNKDARFVDLQLLLYLRMLPDELLPNHAVNVECGYFVLGNSQENTVLISRDFSAESKHADATLQAVIRRIKAGIYWQPSPQNIWKDDYAKLFLDGPHEINPRWIADQELRIQADKMQRSELTT